MQDRHLLRHAIVESLSGRAPCGFHGTPDELRALMDALSATKLFESVLSDETKGLAAVTEALRRKHACARAFEREFGCAWPL